MSRAVRGQAADVEGCARSEALWDATEHESNDKQADGDVEPEDPLPGKAPGDGASHHWTCDESQPGHAAEDAQGTSPSLWWECCTQQCQRQRQHQGRAASLDGASGDEGADGGREPARCRCRDEEQEAGDEHAPASKAVAERCSCQEEHSKAEDVGADGPFELLDGGAQVQADGGECGGDNLGIE